MFRDQSDVALELRSGLGCPNWRDGISPDLPKPFLRWAGGKTRLIGRILPHIPSEFRRYHEPFLGGGAVFFAVQSRAAQGAALSDLNNELINTWRAVRNRPNLFLKAIDEYYGQDLESHYYRIRDEQPRASIARAARFFYLNQTSWNSLWRVNRWGVFNVPWGDRPFRGISAAQVQTLSRTLQEVEINKRDFRESILDARKGDFVYLDPPYLPVSDTSKFSGYTERRFRKTDLEQLADHCLRLSRKNILWVMSNRDTALVRDLFSFAKIIRLTTRRSVSAQNRRDIEPVDSPEVIVVGRTAH